MSQVTSVAGKCCSRSSPASVPWGRSDGSFVYIFRRVHSTPFAKEIWFCYVLLPVIPQVASTDLYCYCQLYLCKSFASNFMAKVIQHLPEICLPCQPRNFYLAIIESKLGPHRLDLNELGFFIWEFRWLWSISISDECSIAYSHCNEIYCWRRLYAFDGQPVKYNA